MKNALIFISCLFFFACSGNNDSGKVASAQQVPKDGVQNVVQQAPQKKNVFASITPQQASKLIQEKRDLLLLDVRSPQELREGKIKGSTLVPFWEIAKGKYTVPRENPVLLICAVGGRSYAVGQYLSRSGYPEVYNLKGGMSAWKKVGLPVIY